LSRGVRLPALVREHWLLVLPLAVGATLRFATLDLQSYWYDEVITAHHVLHANLFDTLSTLPSSESTPPLYYVLAWLWSVPFGTGEVGLRSLSALIGTATIPVAYGAGAALSSRRVGLIAAALVAVSPTLIWYSQEARAYGLLVFLSALSFLFLILALQEPSRRRLLWWAGASALALASHYFAVFLVAPEAVVLLARRRGPWTNAAVAGVVAAGILLLPLAVAQSGIGGNDFIAARALGERLRELPVVFFAAPLGILREAAVPAALVLLGIALGLFKTNEPERRGVYLAAGLSASAVLLPLALIPLGADYFLARNVLAGLVPLLVAVAIGFGATRFLRSGVVLAAGLVVFLLGFSLYVDRTAWLQRDDWRAAADAIGAPRGPRAIIVPGGGAVPLDYYLAGARRDNDYRGAVREVAVLSWPRAPAPALNPPRSFRLVEKRKIDFQFTLSRFRSRVTRTFSHRLLARLGWVRSPKPQIVVDGGA
jgi:mannosyltransferase